jgi:hypothetical protein
MFTKQWCSQNSNVHKTHCGLNFLLCTIYSDRATGWTIRGSIPAWSKNIHTCCGAHPPPSLPSGYHTYFLQCKAVGSIKLITHVRMSGTLPLFPTCALVPPTGTRCHFRTVKWWHGTDRKARCAAVLVAPLFTRHTNMTCRDVTRTSSSFDHPCGTASSLLQWDATLPAALWSVVSNPVASASRPKS